MKLILIVGLITLVSGASAEVFQSARQCTPGAVVKIAPGPGIPNGATGKITGPSAPDDLLCTVTVDGGAQSRRAYWTLTGTGAAAAPVEHVKLAPGSEFKSSQECVPGRAVTVAENLPYDEGGPGVVARRADELSCYVTMAKTGKQRYVTYFNIAPQGAVARFPERVPPGNYGCVTFNGIVSLNSNVAGRVEVRPLWDVRVTGPNAYTGADGRRGTFTYDNTRGEVRFSGGAHDGRVASFLPVGQGKFVFKGENGQIDCGL